MSRINLFTIPAGASFADELARGLLQRYAASDPFALSKVLVLLPTRRSIRTLGDAFVRVAPRNFSVLPRLRALGDFDDEPSLFQSDDHEDLSSEFGGDLPEPLPVLKREILLTKLIQHWSQVQSESGVEQSVGAESPALALRLARELARLFDQATAEGLAWERLGDLVPKELAEHWNKTLTFLTIITENWPALLESQPAIDPSVHRNLALRKAAAQWKESPPDYPIIAAGSTGSVAATAELLRTIAYLPLGAVVLPGLDSDIDAESWEATGPGHPQHGMRSLLEKLAATRGDVQVWTRAGTRADRVRLIAEALRPAETTPRWQAFVHSQKKTVEKGLRGLHTIVARTPSEEALVIACALREAIEVPGRTAALVTPDRNLARRVASELKRWGIEIDDSSGTPLSHTETGRFLSLIADAAADQFAPVPLLALLKHPMSALSYEYRFQAREHTASLEIAILRGPRPAPGLESLRRLADPKAPYSGLIDKLEHACGAFALLMSEGSHDLARFLAMHRQCAELICDEQSLEKLAVWEGEAGDAALATFDSLAEAAERVALVMSGADYAAFIRTVMEAVPVRPHYGRHPRLSILGQLEARLQQADLMILGGLNEGAWPPVTDPGPWLNRPMRSELELSQPERRVGLSAHDFAQAAAAPEVLLTRAEKDGGAPTTPSRWLTRLTMLVEGSGLLDQLADHRLLGIARGIDRPAQPPKAIEPPAPRPPVLARPRKLPVTDVERWVRDPYALYAKRILELKKLDPIDETPGAADRGTVIHKALERFVQKFPRALPDDDEAIRLLLEMGRVEFGSMLERPGVRSFWWPRYERAVRWFLEWEKSRRVVAVGVFAEQKGELTFAAPAGDFTLTASADRIEVLSGDAIVVADYKTGSAPSIKQVKLGFSSQLTLEAAIALAGGFPGLKAASVDSLMFVALRGGILAGEEKTLKFDDMSAEQAARQALSKFQKFVADFDAPDMPYLSKPHVLFETQEGDYDHLARVKEWSSEGEA